MNGQSAQRHSQRVDIAERQSKAVALRRQGKTLQVIADELGVSQMTVSRDIENMIIATHKDNQRAARLFVRQAVKDMDAMREALLPKALAGDSVAISRWLDVVNRQAKLLGAYPQTDAASVTNNNTLIVLEGGVLRQAPTLPAGEIVENEPDESD